MILIHDFDFCFQFCIKTVKFSLFNSNTFCLSHFHTHNVFFWFLKFYLTFHLKQFGSNFKHCKLNLTHVSVLKIINDIYCINCHGPWLKEKRNQRYEWISVCFYVYLKCHLIYCIFHTIPNSGSSSVITIYSNLTITFPRNLIKCCLLFISSIKMVCNVLRTFYSHQSYVSKSRKLSLPAVIYVS